MKALVFVLFAIAVILSVRVYKEKTRNPISVHPIKKALFEKKPDQNLKYFYEPKANSSQENQPNRLTYAYRNTINLDALNERFDYTFNKSADTFRIVTLGDSFTFGLYVDTEDNYPEKLEDSLNKMKCSKYKKFEVINLGVPGYDIRYSVERFIRRGKKYKPDLILWFIKTGDFNKINEVLKKRIFPYDEQLAKEVINLDEYRKLYNKIYEQIIEETKSSYRFEYGLSALKRLQDNYANPIIFFASPNRISDEERRIIATLNKDSGNVLLSENISKEIVALENIMGPTDDHPNTKGYAILARDIFDYLVSSSSLKCN